MSGLSPELKQLLPAYKRANLPTEADSERIADVLRARLGDAAMTGAESVHVVTNSGASGLLFGKGFFVGLAGLAVLSGVWFLAARNPRAALRETNAVSSAATTESIPSAAAPSVIPPVAAPAPQPESSANVAVVAAAPVPNRDSVRPVASHHNRDRLAEEVALLSRAQAALRSGKPAVALEVLKEHERKFGSGLLAEERIAASAQALCALGRNAEADAQLARLSSKSVLGQHSRQVCGSRKSN